MEAIKDNFFKSLYKFIYKYGSDDFNKIVNLIYFKPLKKFKHVMGISIKNERCNELIDIFKSYPTPIITGKDYSNMVNEFKKWEKNNKEYIDNYDKEEEKQRKRPRSDNLSEILMTKQYQTVEHILNDLAQDGKLTKEEKTKHIEELRADLKEDYLDDYVDKAMEQLDKQFVIESGEDFTKDFDNFTNLDPKTIHGVSYDATHGIVKANFTKDRRNRLQAVLHYTYEILSSQYATTDFTYRYYFIGIGWRSIKLHGQESLTKFIETIESYGLYNKNEMDQATINTYYDGQTIPDFEFVDYMWLGPDVNKNIKDGNPEKHTLGGEFYPYTFKDDVNEFAEYYEIAQITDSLSTFNDKGHIIHKDLFNVNCFTYALIQAKMPNNLIEQIKFHCLDRYQKSSKIDKICKAFKLCIKLTHERKDKTANKTGFKYIGAPLNDHEYYVEMGLLREPGMLGDHYFYNPDIHVTSFYLKNRDAMKKWAIEHNKDIKTMHNKQRWNSKKNCYEVKDKNNKIKLFDLLIWTRDNGYFKPCTLEEVLILPTTLYTCIKGEIVDLHYNDFSLKEIKAKIEKKVNKSSNNHEISKYYYADFEASTQGFHKPYCCSYSSRDEDKIHTFYGMDCAWELLNALEDNSLTYFHNLAYDGRFLAKYGIKQCIKKGGKLMSFRISFKGKELQFRDSWAMISSPLSAFPSMFGIKNIQKELYPYNYYTEQRVQSNVGNINEAGKEEIVSWNDEQYKIFNENIDKIPGCRLNSNQFDMQKYCKFYCEQDVNILKIGHMTFKDLVQQELNLDIDKSISISSLANKYFELNVYSQIDELYEYSGVVREYIQGCVKGGRCMTRQNKKWHCTERLYDYDACSLYPSAVYRLKLATGKPIVIPEEWCGDSTYLLDHLMEEQQLNPTDDKYISAFIADIDITSVGKELAFPIIMEKTKQGNKNVNKCCSMRVDNYELEDLIKFQQIKFTIKRGYYWTGARTDLFSKEMKRIYDLRVLYKKQKNPLQLVLKLLMNSTYGKTIQKPIKTELVYKQVEKMHKNGKMYNDAARFLNKNSALVKEYYNISDNIVCFDVNKSFDDFYVPNLIGVQILSMSKRIMNEVMCLAEDLGIMIYYQDTDSMHIPVKDVPRLEEEYYKLYGRVLRGSDMGQFHPDFESDKINGELQSIESYFLGKKAYCDKLANESGEIDYHLRLKGIPNNLLESEYEDPLELYKFMYNGGEYKFNLLKLKPSFEMTKDMKIKTRTQFCRKIKFD